MRLLACLFVMLAAVVAAEAQYRIIGFAYDEDEEPYMAVTVKLTGEDIKMETLTDLEGRFEFHDIPRGQYKVLVITDYGLIEKPLNVRTSLELHLQRSRNVRMDEVVVSAVRTRFEAPIVEKTLEKEDIEVRNLGQDVPFALKWTPSAVTTSDAGTGIGYSGIRIRGTDPTRINVTINGVPLNDAESQGVFWVNLPDLLSSTSSIQIQRGVGESTFGTGAFGATINLNTNETRVDPYGSLSGTVGSFGTYKGTLQFGTGLLGNHWTIDGRISTIQSDGFIDRATADLRSYYGSAAYIGGKTSVRFTTFGGKEVTYQAWNGVPAQYIDDEELRTFNTAGTEREGEPYDNEVDDYTQTHYQLHINQTIFTQLQGYLTAHYTKGKGFFEQYKNPDVSGAFEPAYYDFLGQYGLDSSNTVRRRWLDNDFYGFIAGLYFTDPSEKFTFRMSGGYNIYKGDHFGEVIRVEEDVLEEPLPPYYFNDARKRAGNIFAKLNYRVAEKWVAMLDLQYRKVNYEFEGFDQDSSRITQTAVYKFFNPKFGLTYEPFENFSIGYFGGIANREPNRDDFVNSTEDSRPDPERLFDNELILTYNNSKLFAEVVGYYMKYSDQLALTGELNDVGEATRVNIDDSYRLGVEVNARYKPVERLELGASMTFSQNRVKRFEEYIDDWDTGEKILIEHTDTDLAFSPSTLVMGNIQYAFVSQEQHRATIGLLTKYVGEQFVDNTGNPASRLDAYTFSDLQLTYDFTWKEGKRASVNFLLRNVFNAKYETNAWIYRFRSGSYDPRPDDPYAQLESGDTYNLKGFYPQAGTNFLLGLTLTI